MQIFVRTLEGMVITLEVERDTTVAAIKQMIFEKEGIPVENQKITIAGRPLENGTTVGDYDEFRAYLIVTKAPAATQPAATQEKIHEIQIQPGYRGRGHNCFTLTVKSSDTIAQVKEQIHAKTGIPASEQTLILRNTLCLDGNRVDSYELTYATFHLVPSAHYSAQQVLSLDLNEVLTEISVSSHASHNRDFLSQLKITSENETMLEKLSVLEGPSGLNSFSVDKFTPQQLSEKLNRVLTKIKEANLELPILIAPCNSDIYAVLQRQKSISVKVIHPTRTITMDTMTRLEGYPLIEEAETSYLAEASRTLFFRAKPIRIESNAEKTKDTAKAKAKAKDKDKDKDYKLLSPTKPQ